MKNIMALRGISNKVALGFASVGIAMAAATEASAQTTAGSIANQVGTSVQSLGNLLLSGCFLGGVGFAGSGVIKCKKAADSDGREPFGPGLWRLGVGGALVGLPALTAAMKGTLFGTNTTGATMTGMNFNTGGGAAAGGGLN